MKNLNCETISKETIAKIKKKLSSNPMFVPMEVKSINMAAKSICEWIHAVNNFVDVFSEIVKKRDNCK